MLSELRVADYAIIDQIAIRFAPGLNVMTGETGAGKSIIVGALGFVIGERVSEDVVRKGADACRVEAIFDLKGRGLDHRSGHPIPVQSPDGRLCLARELKRGGRSKCTINGRIATLTGLRNLGDRLVDFHGQHDHQLLLHAPSHLDFLDGFGGLMDLRGCFDERRRTFLELGARVERIRQEIEDIRSKGDLIKYEIAEIEQANIKAGEDAELEREVRLLEHAEKIIEVGTEVMGTIYDSDQAAMRLLSRAGSLLGKIAPYSEDVASMQEDLEQAEVIVKEVGENLRDRLSQIDLDASRLEQLRERRVIIEKLKRKYGQTIDHVLAHLERLKAGMESTERLEAEVEDLSSKRGDLEKELVALAAELSAKRKNAARRFERLTQAELRSLGIAGGVFKVVFEDLEEGEDICGEDDHHLRIGEKGADFAEFFVRTNPGEDLMHLRRIASGGEISRVMLALKKILADVDRIPTLIFDEIDAGIGGSIADVVAGKLYQVAQSRQVVCITHLPQIAALADGHLAVGKTSVGGRTVTEIVQVEGEQRVNEMARMIGGKEPAKSARAHAKEILKRSVAR